MTRHSQASYPPPLVISPPLQHTTSNSRNDTDRKIEELLLTAIIKLFWVASAWQYPLHYHGGALSAMRAQCNYLGVWPC